MYEFKNKFTGESFIGTLEELYFKLFGVSHSLFSKSDVVKSYGWHWDSNLERMIR